MASSLSRTCTWQRVRRCVPSEIFAHQLMQSEIQFSLRTFLKVSRPPGYVSLFFISSRIFFKCENLLSRIKAQYCSVWHAFIEVIKKVCYSSCTLPLLRRHNPWRIILFIVSCLSCVSAYFFNRALAEFSGCRCLIHYLRSCIEVSAGLLLLQKILRYMEGQFFGLTVGEHSELAGLPLCLCPDAGRAGDT